MIIDVCQCCRTLKLVLSRRGWGVGSEGMKCCAGSMGEGGRAGGEKGAEGEGEGRSQCRMGGRERH